MIWSPSHLLRSLIHPPRLRQRMARRWGVAATAEPELVDDVIRLGGIMEMEPRVMVDGVADLAPADPTHIAMRAGRRELALELLALMNTRPHDLRERLTDEDDMV